MKQPSSLCLLLPLVLWSSAACLVSTRPEPGDEGARVDLGSAPGAGAAEPDAAGPDAAPFDSGAPPCEKQRFYADVDGDGLGDPAATQGACEAPPGFVDNADDPQPDCPTNDAEDCQAGELRCHADDRHGREVCERDSQNCERFVEHEACDASVPICSADEAGAACTGCTEASDCEPFADAPLCDLETGRCVECSATDASACMRDATQYVCDPVEQRCDWDRRAESRGLCNSCVDAGDAGCRAHENCVSDSECEPGLSCVVLPDTSESQVCMPVRRGPGSCVRPTARRSGPLVSVSGEEVEVCTFLPGTSCRAHRDFGNKRCGRPSPVQPDVDLAGSGDDALCGTPGLDDGYCLFDGDLGQHRCTVACEKNVSDCPLGASGCDTRPTPGVCVF